MKSRQFAGITLLVFTFVFLSGLALGQNARSGKHFAEISNQGTSVAWRINAPHKSVTLTVAAPNGEVYRREFLAGSIPVFSLVSERAKYYGEGVFTYEITVNPDLSPGVTEALRQSRVDGNSDEVALELKRMGQLPEPLIQSGTFRVSGGQVITPDDFVSEPETLTGTPDETPAKSDRKSLPRTTSNAGPEVPPENVQVINDDLVVLGSECIGLDCPTNPSFGFDTLRLQENNLRINFADTSSTASFPTSDWRIVANDSSNGGASYLAIEDTDAGNQPFRVEAGAGNAALWVTDSGGNVGMGTATPVVELHIADGDTPTVRLEQNGASGFTPQTWDVAGNEAVFFIRDVTNGSRLPFKIQPSAPTDTLFLASNGSISIGVGTSTPTRKLDVNGGIRLRSDVLEFPDGSTQATAAIGSGTNFLTETFAQTVFGGQGRLAGFNTITPGSDFNSFSINTNAQAGFATTQITVPSNINLANQTASNVVYRIRYRDPDGVGAGSNVRVDVVAVNNTGGRATKLIFDSNTNASSVNNTVTICDVNDATYFNYGSRGTHLNITVTGTAALTAELFQVQIFKTNACP